MTAQAEHAQRVDAQLLQQEAYLHAHLEEAKRGLATAQQHAEEARIERDFFMAESTEAAAQAASATAERDAAKQVCSYLMEIAMSRDILTYPEYLLNNLHSHENVELIGALELESKTGDFGGRTCM